GYNITNSYTPATTSISGTKTWSDNNNQDGKRPDSITINLLANGKKVDSQKVSAATNWAYHFDNLPQYENGQVITYTVSEDTVDG
ncbi:Cna B-type domain-containing protein, partial [Streptococcus pyogenes]